MQAILNLANITPRIAVPHHVISFSYFAAAKAIYTFNWRILFLAESKAQKMPPYFSHQQWRQKAQRE